MKNTIIGVVLLTMVACHSEKKEDTVKETVVKVDQQVDVITKIHTEKLKEMLKEEGNSYQLVDVRTPQEVQAGHIEGALTAMNFVSGEFESKLDELDKSKPVIVYCASGGRSNKAANLLKDKGFKQIYDYTDGYSGWSASQ